MQPKSKVHAKTVRVVQSILGNKPGFGVSIGGDGTFLRAAHKLKGKKPILGINADPSHKEGHLLPVPKKNLKSELEYIKQGKYTIEYLPTLQVRINGKKLKLFAINEFFIGAPTSYCTSRYELRFRGKKEVQRSSGLIVATPVGSNAWLYSAQGKKKNVPKNSSAYVVREPFEGRVFKYTLKQGTIKSTESITFVSHMKKAILVADSLSKEVAITYGDTVTISRSTQTIPIIVPK